MFVPRFLLITCLVLTFSVLASAQVVAIRAGHVIDVAAGSALDNQVILVEGGLITAVGSDLAVPSGADVIDLSDAWVMPGMIDAHTHLALTTMPGADINDFGS